MRLRRRPRPGLLGAARAVLFSTHAPVIPPFTPADLTDVWLWLEAGPTYCFSDGGGTTPCADGDLVCVWKDRSGNGHHLSQVASGARPTLIKVRGQWRVQFGSGKFMTRASITAWPSAVGFLSVRQRFNTTSNPNGALFQTTNEIGSGDYYRYVGDGRAYARNFRTSGSRYNSFFAPPVDTLPHTYTQVSDADYRVYLDSVQKGTTQSLAWEAPTSFQLGVVDTFISHDGEIAALVLGGSSLTAPQQADLEDYLRPLMTEKTTWLVSTAGTLKAGNVFTQTNNDTLVAWQDQSGNGQDFTASGGPSIITGQQNGLPAVKFNRSLSSMFFRNDAGTSPLNLPGDMTIFFVMEATTWDDGNSSGVFGKKITDGVPGWQIYHNTAVNTDKMVIRINDQNDYPNTLAVVNATATLFTFQRSGSTYYWYVNGVLRGTGAVSTGNGHTNAPIYIGQAQTWGGYLNGKIYEIIVYDRYYDPTADNAALKTKYGL